MGYSRQEQETTIVWDEFEKIAHIYTASPVSMRKLDKLCAECPDEYARTWTETDGEGTISAARYMVRCKLVKFAKPRVMTEEQREVLAERGRRIMAGNAATAWGSERDRTAEG